MEDREDFRLIAITTENIVDDEAKKIEALIRKGFYRIHLRHPHSSAKEIRTLIESIPLEMHRFLVLHGHFDLVGDFNLGGLHLNKRCPQPPRFYHGALSRSCHSINEIRETTGLTYVTLSPIYDSISKPGYVSGFKPEELDTLSSADTPVYALGGVDFTNVKELFNYTFSGAAMLGALRWELPLEKFLRNIQNLRLC